MNCPHVLDTKIIFSGPSHNLPRILVSVRSDNDGLLPQEVAEGMSVAMAARPVEMEHNWHLLAGTGGGDGNMGSPREGVRMWMICYWYIGQGQLSDFYYTHT